MKDTEPIDTGQYDKNMPLPSQKYGELVKKIPGFRYTLTALDQVSQTKSLKESDTLQLIAYSLWVEYPDAVDSIAETLNITPDRLRADIDHVTEHLEDIWEQVDTLQEDLRGADESASDEIPPVLIPVFEKPVKGSSGRTRSYNLGLIDREEMLFDRMKKILDVREWTVVTETLNGKDNEKIAKDLGLSTYSVVRIRSKARRKIEQEILDPAGFKRLRAIGTRSQIVGAGLARAEGVNLLGIWYDTEEGVTVFDQRSKKADEEMIQQGYDPITWYVPFKQKKDYEWIVTTAKRRGLSIKHKNRWYIKKGDILSLMEERGLDITPI